MNLDHIRYFQAIAYYEHYGRAAQALHVSQPNLNYAVTQLENELGVPLFEKHGRGVQLTRYGRLFCSPSTSRCTFSTPERGIYRRWAAAAGWCYWAASASWRPRLCRT